MKGSSIVLESLALTNGITLLVVTESSSILELITIKFTNFDGFVVIMQLICSYNATYIISIIQNFSFL